LRLASEAEWALDLGCPGVQPWSNGKAERGQSARLRRPTCPL